MSSSVPNYNKLYQLQDRILGILKGNLDPFYLTGGTALGRYYLGHRYSDDLDFFVNTDDRFKELTVKIYVLLQKQVHVDTGSTIDADEFVRIWIDEEVRMKLEFVNDITSREGETIVLHHITLDNPLNILANKLGAILNRDEAKDIFDIVTMADNYSFNWKSVYRCALKKQIMNEQDVLMKITTFPVSWLPEQKWLLRPVNLDAFQQKLKILSSDFLLGNDNSLGKGKIPIEDARPKVIKF